MKRARIEVMLVVIAAVIVSVVFVRAHPIYRDYYKATDGRCAPGEYWSLGGLQSTPWTAEGKKIYLAWWVISPKSRADGIGQATGFVIDPPANRLAKVEPGGWLLAMGQRWWALLIIIVVARAAICGIVSSYKNHKEMSLSVSITMPLGWHPSSR